MARKLDERGVYPRTNPSGRRVLVIQFSYRGVNCRETMKNLDPDNTNHHNFAVQKKRQILAEIAQGAFNYADHFPNSPKAKLFGHAPSDVRVKDVAEAWFKDVERGFPHSTVTHYRRGLDNFLLPALGDRKMAGVSIEDARDTVRQSDLMLKTIRNYLTPARAVFDRGVEDRIITLNPFDHIKPHRLVTKSQKGRKGEINPLTADELERFLAACTDYWRPYFATAAYTGLRPSELYALRWGHVDFDAGLIRVRSAVVMGKEKENKTAASERDVNMLPAARAALRVQRQRTAFTSEFVFVGPNTKRGLDDYDQTRLPFARALKAAALAPRRQYELRHTYATNMLLSGHQPPDIAGQLGHRDLQMLYTVYGAAIRRARTEKPVDFGTSVAHVS